MRGNVARLLSESFQEKWENRSRPHNCHPVLLGMIFFFSNTNIILDSLGYSGCAGDKPRVTVGGGARLMTSVLAFFYNDVSCV